jgi:hypothetical protein
MLFNLRTPPRQIQDSPDFFQQIHESISDDALLADQTDRSEPAFCMSGLYELIPGACCQPIRLSSSAARGLRIAR